MYLLKVMSSLGLRWSPTLYGVWVIISEDFIAKVVVKIVPVIELAYQILFKKKWGISFSLDDIIKV